MKKTLPQDLVEALAEQSDDGARRRLFALLADRVRSRVLTASEAEVLAGWLDQLANGDDPASVFPRRAGRPPGRAGTRYVKGKEITRPNDYDLAWGIRRLIARGHDKAGVFAEVAARYGMKPGSVANLYRRCLRDMPPDPD